MRLAFNPQGEFITRNVLDIAADNLLNLHFDYDENDLHDDEEEICDGSDSKVCGDFEICDDLVLPIIFEVIEPDMYIGLRSPSSSLELFYVVKVILNLLQRHILQIAWDMVLQLENHTLLYYI